MPHLTGEDLRVAVTYTNFPFTPCVRHLNKAGVWSNGTPISSLSAIVPVKGASVDKT